MAEKKKMLVQLIPDPTLGTFTARVPEVPGCGEGDTPEEAVADLWDALIGFVTSAGPEEARELFMNVGYAEVDWDLEDVIRHAENAAGNGATDGEVSVRRRLRA